MRAVIQRVLRSSIKVDGHCITDIDEGLLVLVGFHKNDGPEDMNYIASKIHELRIFNDEKGKMNLSLRDIEGELLVVSQFTLYGDARKGRRPSYSDAMTPDDAIENYNKFIKLCEQKYNRVKSGIFGADMKITLINSGPVTILLDSSKIL